MREIQATLIVFVIIAFVVIQVFSAFFSMIEENINGIILCVLSVLGVYVAYQIYSELFFRSNRFKTIKESISEHTKNSNELNHYIEELKGSYINIESYNYGLGNMIDDSNYNFERKEWNKDIKNNQIHHCSATVCKNASSQPIKYLCKYFNIEKTEESLSGFEKVLNDFTSAEQGRNLLQKERDDILKSISKSIPLLIFKFNKKKLSKKLGFEIIDISDSYIPIFSFQYISAGGNSSSSCDIRLDIENLNILINYLNDLIKWRKSVAGQRALMTSKLREKIKLRDNYSCCSCSLSIRDEKNLLLEIDHIIPLSKGGMTKEDNLQTLCWRCNRTKGSKIQVSDNNVESLSQYQNLIKDNLKNEDVIINDSQIENDYKNYLFFYGV